MQSMNPRWPLGLLLNFALGSAIASDVVVTEDADTLRILRGEVLVLAYHKTEVDVPEMKAVHAHPNQA